MSTPPAADAISPSRRPARARQFARWVFENRDRLPPEFANFPEDVIRKQFEMCYPFHPGTLTVFQRKWQSLSTFQQTRGTLAMLGLWIAQAYREGYRRAWREPLITLGSAPLYDREFRSKILEQLGETRLEAAIEYDIAGENAHAVALDKEAFGGAGRVRLHQRVATALFFESCGGMAPDKAATLPDLRFAIADPETETALVDTAVQALAARCYYLRPVGVAGWRFGYRPTLRRVQADRRAALDPGEVERQAREAVRRVFQEKREIDIVYFPATETQVPDRPALTLIVWPPEEGFSEQLRQKLTVWTMNCGRTPRQYPGGLLWLVPERATGLRTAVEDWLAWQVTAEDAQEGRLGELESQDYQMLRSELKKAREAVEERVWSAYNRLLVWDGGEQDLRIVALDQMHPSEAQGITAAILARLRQEALLNREVRASYVERHWPPALKESGAWPLAGLRAAFFQGHLTRLEKAEEALRHMILRAVRQGIFGLGVGSSGEELDRVWFREEVDPAEISFDHETFLLLPARATRAKVPVAPVTTTGYTVPDTTATGIPAAEPAVPPSAVTSSSSLSEEVRPSGGRWMEWRGNLPKDKWNLFSHRVLARLGSAGRVEIEVAIRAEVEDVSVGQQVNLALQELGLEGGFTVVVPKGKNGGK